MKHKILIADSNAENAFFLEQRFFELPGRIATEKYTAAGDIAEYLQFTCPGDFDLLPGLILLNVNVKAGWEASLKNLKAHSRFRAIPVIIFSFEGPVDLVRRAYELGAGSFFCQQKDTERLKEDIEMISRFWFDVASIPFRRSIPSFS